VAASTADPGTAHQGKPDLLLRNNLVLDLDTGQLREFRDVLLENRVVTEFCTGK
jgi:hypothetical protein